MPSWNPSHERWLDATLRSVKDSGVPLADFAPLGRDAGAAWTLFALPPAEEPWDEEALRFALGLLLSVPAPERTRRPVRKP